MHKPFLRQHRNFRTYSRIVGTTFGTSFKAMCKEVEESQTKTMYHTLPKSVSLGIWGDDFYWHSAVGLKTTT